MNSQFVNRDSAEIAQPGPTIIIYPRVISNFKRFLRRLSVPLKLRGSNPSFGIRAIAFNVEHSDTDSDINKHPADWYRNFLAY